MCAILRTKLLITSTGAPSSDVHRDVLAALQGALDTNKLAEFVPDLTATSYLGPDPYAPSLSLDVETAEGLRFGRSARIAIGFAIGCGLLLTSVLACAAHPGLRKATSDALSRGRGRLVAGGGGGRRRFASRGGLAEEGPQGRDGNRDARPLIR